MTDGVSAPPQADAWDMPEIPGKAQAAVAAAVAVFGAAVAPKLAGPGEPEDQLRSPLETLLVSVAKDLGLKVNPVGESSLSDLKVRPDYAIEVDGALAGYIEVKAPGKGADPTAWSVKSRDRQQWEKLKELPNVLYTDGNSWALYSKGVRNGPVVRLNGDVKTSGAGLTTDGPGLAAVLDTFLRWEPQAPRTLAALVNSVAGLCRLLREEVAETLRTEKHTGGPFTRLADDWRTLLFPDADDSEFADGYAQTVTFALLLARVEGISFAGQPISEIARQLGKGHSLMGKALSVLTDESLGTLSRTIDTLLRVVGAVDWGKFEHEPEVDLGLKHTERRTKRNDPYLHLYERFLEVYDPELRKQTGSYYTPVQVVDSMIGMVDGLLKDRLGQPLGFASDHVTVVDPAMGTGTYLLNVIEHAAAAIAEEEGEGSVAPRLKKMAERVIGFEKQAGPYAVAEMRGYEALRRHKAEAPKDGLRLYVADTLDNPNAEVAHMYSGLEPIARSRKEANKVKRDEPVMVVIGNPPYKDKAKGLGGWIEEGAGDNDPSPMNAFKADGNGKYEYVLSNLYAYFWRWATWKVFDHHDDEPAGVVAFITTSGYTTSPGFAGMREYMRRACDEGWIIDLSPEGHQPDVATRVFPGVAQSLCIGIFARYGTGDPTTPARLHYRAAHGHRDRKFEQLADIDLHGDGWLSCPDGWQDRFGPEQGASWLAMPAVADLLPWQTPGIKPNRAWVYAPDTGTLARRWNALVNAPAEAKSSLFRESRDANLERLNPALPGQPPTTGPFAKETGPCPAPVPVSFRAFDRQWLIPDARLIATPRTDLWRSHGPTQVYASELHSQGIRSGPALVFGAHPPDQHHYRGSGGGRVLPLYRDAHGSSANLAPGLLQHLTVTLGATVTPEDVLAYVAALVAHPAFTAKHLDDLKAGGVRVPLTATYAHYQEAVVLGRELLWLHTYGERYTDPSSGRPAGPPRLPADRRPKVVVAIPDDEAGMPDALDYDAATETLSVGLGRIRPVPPGVWSYDIDGVNVLKKWFGYRKKDPAGLKTSPLDKIHADTWSPDTTTDLLSLLNVVGRVVDLQDRQSDLLERICEGPVITVADLQAAGVLPVPDQARSPLKTRSKPPPQQGTLL